jgi:hypothetical protein
MGVLADGLCADQVRCGYGRGNTAVWSVVSENTSTLGSAGMTIDPSTGNLRAATKNHQPRTKQGAS